MLILIGPRIERAPAKHFEKMRVKDNVNFKRSVDEDKLDLRSKELDIVVELVLSNLNIVVISVKD